MKNEYWFNIRIYKMNIIVLFIYTNINIYIFIFQLVFYLITYYVFEM